VGPTAEAIEAMGDKIRARNLVAAAGVPVSRGTTSPVADAAAAVDAARDIGFPLMVKASAGGGGMGMAVAPDEESLPAEYERVRGFAERMFGDPAVLLERFYPSVRHVEVQVLGLADGRVVALGERDCSVQRRNQKLVEETPSPAVDDALRRALCQAAVRAGETVGYRGAGTVEFLLDTGSGEFVFLEMNTRLQVEHPITEMVTGLDLVEQQLLIAGGEPVGFDPEEVPLAGHAIEMRINAEDPKRFLPGPGAISAWEEPAGEGVRVDSGYTLGNVVTPHYDSLLAKLVVHGADREEALARARAALSGFRVEGPKCNLAFFTELLDTPEFASGAYDTGIVGRMRA
jgi:acetyl-CoA carboxylase, biotin carboxylase subunit